MYEKGLKQGEIAKALGLCRKTVNKYLQCINQEEAQCNLSPFSADTYSTGSVLLLL